MIINIISALNIHIGVWCKTANHLMFLNIVLNFFSWMISTEYISETMTKKIVIVPWNGLIGSFCEYIKIRPVYGLQKFQQETFTLLQVSNIWWTTNTHLFFFCIISVSNLCQSWRMSNSYIIDIQLCVEY